MVIKTETLKLGDSIIPDSWGDKPFGRTDALVSEISNAITTERCEWWIVQGPDTEGVTGRYNKNDIHWIGFNASDETKLQLLWNIRLALRTHGIPFCIIIVSANGVITRHEFSEDESRI